jgi:flagellar L-ring protein precursor FlgH
LAPQISSPGTLYVRLAGVVLVTLALGACNILPRLAEVGRAPDLSRIENPARLAGKQPVQMPMPQAVEAARQPNSLWRPGSQHFLKDQRAAEEGDIVTVNIEIQDKAQISNTTNRSRIAAEDSSASSILGYEASLAQILPEAIDPTNLIDLDSSGSTEGAGSVNRDESIELRVAALVTQVLPNGNLVIAGRQEVRVNFEIRDLKVAGIIRPEDITSTNTIEFDQIAEARISYGGRGQITDVQQPRYGQQIFDILWPF